MKLMGDIGCFAFAYLFVFGGLSLSLFIVSSLVFRMSVFEGPAGGLPTLYVCMILAAILSIPISIFWVFGKRKS